VVLVHSSSAHPTWGIVVDRQGQVYFSDLKTIWKIDVQNKLSIFRTEGEKHTHALNIDEAGNVYGEDDFSAIWKITPAGGFSYISPPTDNPPKGVSIWKDRDGNTYSVEQNNHLKRETLLLKRTPGGNVSVLAGGSYGHADGKGSTAKFSNIVGMAFGADDFLYLTDGSSVRKVKLDGTVTTLAHNVVLENALSDRAEGTSSFGIAVDAQGNAFVADYGNRRIFEVTPNKRITTVIRSEDAWYPTGVAERNGELYILEESHTPDFKPLGVRVRKLSQDRKVSTLATVGENINPPTRVTPVSTSTAPVLEPRGFSPYWLIGLFASVFAMSFVVWRICRSKSHDYPKQNRVT
jgi:sugar lactone lactonase YvrE